MFTPTVPDFFLCLKLVILFKSTLFSNFLCRFKALLATKPESIDNVLTIFGTDCCQNGEKMAYL